MTTSTLTMDRQACFQFKTSFTPCTILQMMKNELETLAEQLQETVNRAPHFFQGSPIVIDLEKLKTQGEVDFVKLKEILRANNLVPVGVRGGNDEHHIAAALQGLPMLTIGKLTHGENPKNKTIEQHQPTKLVTSPIRSGMQVYAKDADLIVTAPVSAGAELLADGNIHVYGPLRGRAMAGVQGNMQARIFCRTLEAELVSIAGYYLTKEDMQIMPEKDGMIQIVLSGEQVKIEMIS